MPSVKCKGRDGWFSITNGSLKASETTYGVAKVATMSDVEEGVKDDAFITPLKMGNVLFEKNKHLIHYDWIGTLAEYEEQVEEDLIDPNWICFITDDEIVEQLEWGNILGQITNQTDLISYINQKVQLPDQTDQAGKFLSTNGTNTSWATISDTNAVHKTGNETVGGNKTFTGLLSVQNEIHVDTQPNDSTYLNIRDTTTDGEIVLANASKADGSWKGHYALQYNSETDKSTGVLDFDYTKTPIPTEDTTSSRQIDTVGARNTKLQNYHDTTKQDTLVSGTNIKTINNTTILGSGNIAVQPTLVSGTNIKTINGNSVLGSGNLEISGLPPQSGQSGKFLTTDGTSASWETVSVNAMVINDYTA